LKFVWDLDSGSTFVDLNELKAALLLQRDSEVAAKEFFLAFGHSASPLCLGVLLKGQVL
jgi:hypothetical protein